MEDRRERRNRDEESVKGGSSTFVRSHSLSGECSEGIGMATLRGERGESIPRREETRLSQCVRVATRSASERSSWKRVSLVEIAVEEQIPTWRS